MLKPALIVCTLAKHIPQIDCDYIGVDRGALLLAQNKKMMELAIGDFDSIEPGDNEIIKKYSCRYEKLNPIKNYSDSNEAIEYAKKLGYKSLILTGVTGGRADHQYVNERLLINEEDVDITIIDEKNYLKLYKRGTYHLESNGYKYISFFAIEDSVISLKGMKYPLDNYLMVPSDVIGLSNEITDSSATLEVHQGKILCIQSND